MGRAALALRLVAVSDDHGKTIEAMFLLAIRRLHGTYASGPISRPSYVDLSESQRNAEEAA